MNEGSRLFLTLKPTLLIFVLFCPQVDCYRVRAGCGGGLENMVTPIGMDVIVL